MTTFPPKDIPKYVAAIFIVIMGLALSASTLVLAWKTHSLGGWLLAPLDVSPSFNNVDWDDFCYIPRINAASIGGFFSDPWNNFNPAWRGWGPFGLLPPLLAGAFVRLAQNYVLGMTIWTVLNFFLLSWLFFRLLRGAPFFLDRSLGVLFTFALLSAPWLAAQSLGYHGDLPTIAWFGVVRHSLTRIECGLLTYLPYGLFLLSYWRFTSAPTLKRSIVAGGCVGLLGYVYFYHYAFAFFLLAARGALFLIQRKNRYFLYVVVSVGVGLLIMMPALINVAGFEHVFGENLYHERLDYSAGRIVSLREYFYLSSLLFPVLVGMVYSIAVPKSHLKSLLLGELAVMCLAYFGILHLRMVLGFMQAYDHFWRYSLGIPATLWSCAVIADSLRLFTSRWPRSAQWIRITVMVLPVFILIRGVTFASSNISRERKAWSDSPSMKQTCLIEQMEIIDGFLDAGDGFIAADTPLNYHIMVNMKARPFVAFGLSPLSIENLSRRALIASYLVGSDDREFPTTDRRSPDFLCETDDQLYLYINLFESYLCDPDARQQFVRFYREWASAEIDWESWRLAFGNVRAVIVNSDCAVESRKRLQRVFSIEREAEVRGITVFKVRSRH